ncbi:MAG: hypothetical protein EPN33_05405 [Acidobacteria bacterium]|nr:MAG: hypothetical protein EPN33_05405 [Acidobacteriota bacterium]
MDNPATQLALNLWLSERQAIVLRLSDELRAGFQAVAEFHARNYLDCIERQEVLAARLAAHDAQMPELPAAVEDKRRLADAVRAMNTSLRHLADIHAALIDLGSRSARCFQRVWALGAASYTSPVEKGR